MRNRTQLSEESGEQIKVRPISMIMNHSSYNAGALTLSRDGSIPLGQVQQGSHDATVQ